MENVDLIVSFTTYKPRLKAGNTLKVINAILKQKTTFRFGICITLHKDDLQYITPIQKKFFERNNIEIIEADLNLRPHLKYFYVMQKYRDVPIVTVDDDNLYKPDLLQSLWDSYKKYPNCVSARRVHKITYTNGKINSYQKWQMEYKNTTTPSIDLFATGVGGVLYPPDCLKISNDDLPFIQLSLTADDIYLKKKETDFGIDVVYVPSKDRHSYDVLPEFKASYALCFENVSRNKNNDIIKNLKFTNRSINTVNKRSDIMLDIINAINIFLRVNDAIEAVNGKREFGNGKPDIVLTCFDTIVKSIRNAAENGFDVKLTIINDKLSNSTKESMEKMLSQSNINAKWIPTVASGNIGTFKTCFNEALKCNKNDLILFLEDDYLCDINAISEIIRFYGMFNTDHNNIFMNPTTDVGDDRLVHVNKMTKKYDNGGITLPSSRSGIGIFWRQTYHSTSTFATNAKTLKNYKYVFDNILKQQKLNQYTRNKIYRKCACFTPVYPLMQHYQKSYTMYWFDERNSEKEYVYNSDQFQNQNLKDKII